MRYRSQSISYWYFAIAMCLFALQMVFGLLAAVKYLGPDPLIDVLPFDRVKAVHTNLLIVWVLTGFMGATYFVVPEESRTEIWSGKLAYWQLGRSRTSLGLTGFETYDIEGPDTSLRPRDTPTVVARAAGATRSVSRCACGSTRRRGCGTTRTAASSSTCCGSW